MLRQASRRRVAGSSLIEVLVAILVVSLGILAMAGLLGVATRFGKTTEFRSVATLLAADMADRMRANYLPSDPKWKPNINVLNNATLALGAPAAVACANPDNCQRDEMAAVDLAAWQAALYKSLPSGTGYINPTDASGTLYDLWVIWRDPDAEGTNVVGNASNVAGKSACPPNFSTAAAPRCMHFRISL